MQAGRKRGWLAGTSAGLLVLALSLAAVAPAGAHETPTRAATKVLGTIHFPTTTRSPAAQAAFIQGMLYLHLFEYPAAAREFQRAQALDPGFAMAYWGEAMSYTHPLWNQQDLDAGRVVLARLGATPVQRAAKAGDARERDFLAAVEGLYGEGEKHARDLALLAAMEAMSKRYPDDDEVSLFLALALLGADGGKRDLPRFLRAAEIAEGVYRRNPRHPGAAHYWIHGRDDPQHAAGALEAAQALARIAPDAGHSQHMTSHIFVALGRWQDVVEANEAALRVVNADLAAKSQPRYQCGHYAEWLQYSWLQQGREAQSRALLAECERTGAAAVAWLRAHPGSAYLTATSADQLAEGVAASLEHLRQMALVDSPAQRGELLARAPEAQAGAGLWLARGLAALDAGDAAAARTALARLQPAAQGNNGGPFLRIMAGMLEGAIAAREGDSTRALARLRAAAEEFDAQPVDYGPPRTGKPPRELLGEVLLAAGRRDEARAEFERALAGAPHRRAALAGLAAAAASAPADSH
jgi:tetratricopeptide (TPR) repeat protein